MIKNSIVLVPFPFDDFSASKVRPALCLTSEIGQYDHVIIAFISSKITEDLAESDFVIKRNTEDSKGTGLAIDSVIRLHKMVTIPTSLIKRKLGIINKDTEKIISGKLRLLFEL
ncbi:MAG: type II toxin-antitoxin system PemK/MazF family toxin [Bacteroidota bacterium]|nr:growth inhibitor PemK [Odoribacter sp.]MDP3180390.1 type II toxin-antitoxin system PemK/MazF family toxin [Bacteroidota bacterium]MDP3642146.1 type II toxin-antitoxin system PemK/MazF family toxin [Bacteroidota bacterium]